MKNKKTLHLAIALAISSMPLFSVAEANIYIGTTVGDDYTVNASADAIQIWLVMLLVSILMVVMLLQ